ncbi:MAG: DUF975 family protein [Candidatus Woesearchaeota archaeon]
MPKKHAKTHKITKTEVQESIRRLHRAAKKKEPLKVQKIKEISVRELPPQPEQEVVEVKAAPIDVQEAPSGKPVEEELPEPVAEKEELVEEPKHSGKKVVIGTAIEFGWTSVKSHFWFFVGIFLLFASLSFMSFYATGIGTRIVLGLLVSGITLGYAKLALDIVEGRTPEFKELFSCFSLLWKYLLALIIYVVVVSVGLLLLVVPGVIWAVQFVFYPFVIVTEKLGPLKALRKSSALSAGVKTRLIVFALALLGINLLGVIALGIGIIVTFPLSMIALAHVYRQLENA